MVWYGVVWCGVVWCGVMWCGVVWCGMVWCGVVWRGVVWCGVGWCGVVCVCVCEAADEKRGVEIAGRGIKKKKTAVRKRQHISIKYVYHSSTETR